MPKSVAGREEIFFSSITEDRVAIRHKCTPDGKVARIELYVVCNDSDGDVFRKTWERLLELEEEVRDLRGHGMTVFATANDQKGSNNAQRL